jgi:hypothetical protein
MLSLNGFRHFGCPWQFRLFLREFDNISFKLLDVGAGNHSVRRFCNFFPKIEYYGIDISKQYNNDENDFALMKDFWEIDLTTLEFGCIPNDFFDVINMSHIIEPLYNGDEVISALIPKLKRKGIIYIEFPGYQSTKLPHMRGTLNFFDDPSHVRIFSCTEVYNILMKNGCRPLRGGTRRRWVYILMMPLWLPIRLLKYGYLEGGNFWDLLGFAEYVFARRM